MSAEQRYFGARVCPTFEQFCLDEGYIYEAGATLTRIERQIGGGRFPEELQVFGDLRKAHLYNPFPALKMVPTGTIRGFTPPTQGVSIRDSLAAYGLSTLMHDYGGAQQAFSLVQRYGNGNGKRVFESLLSILPPERPPFTEVEIFEAYARSTERQVTGHKDKPCILAP